MRGAFSRLGRQSGHLRAISGAAESDPVIAA